MSFYRVQLVPVRDPSEISQELKECYKSRVRGFERCRVAEIRFPTQTVKSRAPSSVTSEIVFCLKHLKIPFGQPAQEELRLPALTVHQDLAIFLQILSRLGPRGKKGHFPSSPDAL